MTHLDRPAAPQEVVIDVFADACCPFTHVGLRRLVANREKTRRQFRLRVRAWPLELVNGEPLSPGLVAEEAEALRRQVDPLSFARFDPSRFPPTSLPALALAAAAYEDGLETGERVSLALRNALFEEGRDIADAAVLAAIAAEHGVGQPTDRHHELVLADWREGRQRGVQGSPHFFAGRASLFCPVLDIRRVDGRLAIAVDDSALDRLLAGSNAPVSLPPVVGDG